MKFLYGLLISFVLLSGVKAQDTIEPFFKATKFKSGFYFQADLRVTQMLGKAGMVTGFSANWLVNNTYYLGAQYQQLTSQINIGNKITPASPSEAIYPLYRNAGLRFGYILFHNKLVSFSPDLSLNWVNVKYDWPHGTVYNWNAFMAEPQLNVVITPLKFCSVGLGVAYRVHIGMSVNNLRNKDFNGVSGIFFVRFGTLRK